LSGKYSGGAPMSIVYIGPKRRSKKRAKGEPIAYRTVTKKIADLGIACQTCGAPFVHLDHVYVGSHVSCITRERQGKARAKKRVERME
jgi:hypothetical protein